MEEVHTLPPGWSREDGCRLPQVEKKWLDPEAGGQDIAPEQNDCADASNEMARRFADWLNHALGPSLPLGEDEHSFWARAVGDRIKEMSWI